MAAGGREGGALLAGLVLCLALPATAQEVPATGSDYGGAGLIEMRNARFRPDGTLEAGAALRRQRQFWFLNFQALPFLETTFRLTDRLNGTTGRGTTNDRAFDLKVRVWEESAWRPALAVGLQDAVGTGIYGGEYLVASKRFGPLDVSLGMGWGRLGTGNDLPNPLGALSGRFKTRPRHVGEGGTPNFGSYFHGEDVALFGGVEWSVPTLATPFGEVEGLRAKLEWSGDALRDERGGYPAKTTGLRGQAASRLNVGLQWQPNSWLDVGAHFVNGTDALVRLSLRLDPARPPEVARAPPPAMLPRPEAAQGSRPEAVPSTRPEAMLPMRLEAERTSWPEAVLSTRPEAGPSTRPEAGLTTRPEAERTSWPEAAPSMRPWAGLTLWPAAAPPPRPEPVPPSQPELEEAVAPALRAAGFRPVGVEVMGSAARIAVEGGRFPTLAQVAGRVVRAAQPHLPPEVERIEVEWHRTGAPVARLVVLREAFEGAATGRGSAEEVLASSTLLPVEERPFPAGSIRPGFAWAIEPRLALQLGDPGAGVRWQAGVVAGARYGFGEGFAVAGSVAQALAGNLEDGKPSNSELPHVRSDIARYAREGKTSIPTLYGERIWTLAPDVFARVTGGLLEPMYQGVSSEVLWRPVTRNWALGLDLAWVAQREYRQRFAALGYTVATGHASVYADLPVWNLYTVLRAGRYLAGDWGGTIEVGRRFDSGIEVGAFATFTNVSFSQFGEGSFDKGIYVRIPLQLLGPETAARAGATIRPVIRDGGQRLVVDNPLWEVTREGRMDALARGYMGFLQ